MDQVDNDLTSEPWAALKEAWQGCAYCGATDGPLQRDCVMAILPGGRYTVDNVVPACASCNTSKCNDEVTGWLRRKRIDERRFLTRCWKSARPSPASVRKVSPINGVSRCRPARSRQTD